MFLKSLTLKGFKSFADATTLDFEPGVTVVVGPNGSGKSNVVDAVAWVLGAQGPSTVRSAKMDDVIFAGTPSRPALGRAEVSLTIDNGAGSLPIDFAEVTLTRTLFRSGDSEYAINRVPCRLLDIQELLSDTGVGRQQHVIVSQGNLDSILSSRAEERRSVIEEAAGILKFRRRKEKSERRLESTEASLVRLQDLLREVRRQLRPLEKQAEAARRHGDVASELLALRRHLAGREMAAAEARLAAAARQRGDIGRAEEELRAALAALDSGILSAEAELKVAGGGRVTLDLAEAVSRAEGLRARAQGLAAVLGERHRSLERELAAAADGGVIASLEAEAASCSELLRRIELDAAALVPDEQEVAAAEAALEAERDTVDSRWRRRDGPTVADPAAEVRGELGARRSALERTRGEARRAVARSASLRERVDHLEAESSRLRSVVALAEDVSRALGQAREEAAEAVEKAEATLAGAAEDRRAADVDHQRWKSRGETLSQALDQVRARAGAERLAAVGGVVGTLLELVDIDPGWEAAFEAGVGEALAAVVVEGVDAGRRGLAELHRMDVEGAVLALPDATADPRARPQLPPGVVGLRSRVRAWLPGARALLDRLLAGVVVAEAGWEQALDVAVAHPELVVVTPEGDRCAGGLWRTGAGCAGATGAAVEEALVRASEAEERALAAADAVSQAQAAAVGARSAEAEAAAAATANTNRLRSAGETLQRVEDDLARARSELDAAVARHVEAAARLEREQQRVAELEAALPALEEQAQAAAEQAAAERAERARLSERAGAIAALRRDLEVREAGLDERRALTASRLDAVEQRLARNTAGRDAAAAVRKHLESAAVATDRLAALAGAYEARLAEALERLRAARRAEAEATRSRAEWLEQLRRQRGAAERQLSELRERAARVDLDDTEARVRLEALGDTVRRDLDCEPETTRDTPCPPLPAGTSAASRRSELERELRLMGPINPLALEEFTALQERHQFLEAQLEDIRSARRELAKVIRAVDTEIVELFSAAYADVAANFEALFATLFPGGQGRLRLTDPDHLLGTGIEIEAKPSGKNVRRLSLLSGGERSLTAMAFLFAVFRSLPSPFYLMDEVEAALDDVNLHRFLDLVHEFRAEAQLVIVSHQKRTMEAADCLYGVTMAPGGSSRVVTERVPATTA